MANDKIDTNKNNDDGENVNTKRDNSSKGTNYEKSLINILMLRCVNENTSFEIHTQLLEAGCFDDVVYCEKKDDKRTYYLMQLKLKENIGRKQNKICEKDLFPKNIFQPKNTQKSNSKLNTDYSLLKYFRSYLYFIRNNKKWGDKPTMIIYTNSTLQKKIRDIMDSRDKGNILKDSNIFETEDGLYKMDKKIFNKVTIKNSYPTEEFKWKVYAFCQNIVEEIFIHLEECSGFCSESDIEHVANKIYDSVLKTRKQNETNSDNKMDDSTFQMILNEQLENRKNYQKEKKMWNDTNSNLKKFQELIIKKLGKKIEDKNDEMFPWHKINFSPEDEIIEDFFSSLIIAVDQPNEEKNRENIYKEIKKYLRLRTKELPSEEKIKLMMKCIAYDINKWYEDKKSTCIDNKLAEEILNVQEDEIRKKVSADESIEYSTEYIFKKSDLGEFLSEDSGIYIIYSTNTTLSMQKLYQSLDQNAYYFTKEKYLSKAKMELFKDKRIIIECKLTGKSNDKNLWWVKINEFRSELKNKFIVLVVPEEEKEQLYKIEDVILSSDRRDDPMYSDLTDESKIKLNNKNVYFQGKQLKVKDIYDENMAELIDSQILSDLLLKDEVFIEKPPMELKKSDAAFIRICSDEIETGIIAKQALDSTKKFVFSVESWEKVSAIMKDKDFDIWENFCFEYDLNDMEYDFNDIEYDFNAGKDIGYKNTFIFIKHQGDKMDLETLKKICLQSKDDNITYLVKVKFIESSFKCCVLQVYYPNFYFERRFMETDEMTYEEFNEEVSETKDNFFFCIFRGQYNHFIKQLENKNLNQSIKNKLKDKENGSFKIVNETKNFTMKELCNQYSKLYWKSIEGDILIGKFSPWKTKRHPGKPIDENNFKRTFPFVIFVNSPGMGKTTTLMSLSEKMLDSKWVIRISFNECHEAINKFSSERDHLDLKIIAKFLLEMQNESLVTSSRESLLEYALENGLPNSRNVLLVFDGFDELDPQYQEIMLNILNFLQEKSRAIIWISSRPYALKVLKEHIKVFNTMKIKQLDKDEQKKFLLQFWKAYFCVFSDHEKRKEECCDYLIKESKLILNDKSVETINETDLSIKGLPLQLRLVSEGFKNDIINFLNEKEEGSFTSKYNVYGLLDMYELYIKTRYDIYFYQKIFLDNNKTFPVNALKRFLDQMHEILAMTILFPKYENIKKIPGPEFENIKGDIKSVGIIQSLESNTDIFFIHKTFAEYFVASFLNRMLVEDNGHEKYSFPMIDFIIKEVMNPTQEMIRTFLNHMVAGENCLHTAVLQGDTAGINFYCSQGKNGFIDAEDRLGRTALHLCAQKGHAFATQTLLHYKWNGLKRDKLGKLPLHYATQFDHPTTVMFYLDYYTKIDVSKDNIFCKPLLNSDDLKTNNIFELKPEIVTELEVLISSRDKCEHTALFYAVQSKSWDSALLLILHGADIDDFDKNNARELMFYIQKNQNHYKFFTRYKKELCQVVCYLIIKFPKLKDDFLNKIDEFYSPENHYLWYLINNGHLSVIDTIFEDNYDVKILCFSSFYLHENRRPSGVTKTYSKFMLSDSNHLKIIKYAINIIKKGHTKYQKIYFENLSLYLSTKGHNKSFDYMISQVTEMKHHLDSFNEHLSELASQFKPDEYYPLEDVLTQMPMLMMNAMKYDQVEFVSYLWEKFRGNLEKKTEEEEIEDRENMWVSKSLFKKHILKNEKEDIPMWAKSLIITKYVFENGLILDDKNWESEFQKISNEHKDKLDIIKYLQHRSLEENKIEMKITRDQNTENPVKFFEKQEHFKNDIPIPTIRMNEIWNKIREKKHKKNNENNKSGTTQIIIQEQRTRNIDLHLINLYLYQLNDKSTTSNEVYYAVEFIKPNDITKNKYEIFNNDDSNNYAQNENKECNEFLSKIKKLFDFLRICDTKEAMNLLKWFDKESELQVVVNTRDNRGNTILHYATRNRDFNMVWYILEHGGAYNAKNVNRETPCDLSHDEKLTNLLSLINNFFDGFYKNVPHSVRDCFNVIISKVCDSEKQTLLHKRNTPYWINYLINKNADLEAKDCERKTPLMLAVSCGNIEVVKILLEKGANINVKDIYNNSVLHLAAEHDRINVYIYLSLEFKKNENIKNIEDEKNYVGETPNTIKAKTDFLNKYFDESTIAKYKATLERYEKQKKQHEKPELVKRKSSDGNNDIRQEKIKREHVEGNTILNQEKLKRQHDEKDLMTHEENVKRQRENE